jgi:prephenate dehydrogenase
VRRFEDAVVVGGAGAVGQLFTGLLRTAGARVTGADLSAPVGPDWVAGDVRAPDGALAAALSTCDVVVCAVPEPVLLDAVGPVAALLPEGALFVDTTSVKSRVVPAVAGAVPGPAVSLNPMFAPSLGFAGRAVAAVPVRPGAPVEVLEALLTGAGARVVRLDAPAHDRLTAVTQAATHAAVLAFGLAAADSGVAVADLLALAPPPHRALLALLARIVSGAPETYWDIQEANPYAGAARAALRAGLDELDVLAGLDPHAGFDGFAGLVGELRELLGEAPRAQLADDCAGMFTTLARD